MRGESQPEARAGSSGTDARRAGTELDRRYPVALVLYGILGLLIWFTLGDGKIFVLGKPVELRLIPLLIVGSFVLRTVLAREADRIRHGGEKSS